jgi:hypothetical protein
MNDEDFARQAFATAFAAEPKTLPDAEALAFRGRRAARNRRGIYAAGTTALAGVVTAGVAGGPSLLNLGAGSGSTTGTAAAGSGPSVSPSVSPSRSPSQSPDAGKPSGSPCATPPAIDWAGIIAAALPAGIHAVSDHAVNCLDFPEGSRSIEAGFKLSVPGSVLQIEVEHGGMLAHKLGETAPPLQADSSSASPTLDPSALASLQALKRSMADPSTMASLDAKKQSMAAQNDAAARAAKESAAASAKYSAAAGATSVGSDSVDKTPPSCQQLAADVTACASAVTKGGFVGTEVQLIRTGADPVVIDVVAASGDGTDAPSPAPGTKAPLNAAQVTAIAQALVAHF